MARGVAPSSVYHAAGARQTGANGGCAGGSWADAEMAQASARATPDGIGTFFGFIMHGSLDYPIA